MKAARVSVPLSDDLHKALTTISECTERPLSGVIVDLLTASEPALVAYARMVAEAKAFPLTMATSFTLALTSSRHHLEQATRKARLGFLEADGGRVLDSGDADGAAALLPVIKAIETAEAEDRAKRR